MFYDCLGGNQYRITVKIYRDCNSTGAPFDQNLPITVFDGNGVQIDNFTIPFPGSTTLPVAFNNNLCVTVPSNICIEEGIYQTTVTLPNSTTGYTLAYQRCCRGPNVTNLLSPAGQGLTLITEIPVAAVAACNNSPRYNLTPPVLLCTGEQLQFDHSATDPDGDAFSLRTLRTFSRWNFWLSCSQSLPRLRLIIWCSGALDSMPITHLTIRHQSILIRIQVF